MKKWYELISIDTLFFRGSLPLEAGFVPESLFPPPVSVILGSFRTAVLIQKGISFKDYAENKAANEIYELIGKPGEDPPFSVAAVLLKKGDVYYAPAPANWYLDGCEDGILTECKIVKTGFNKDAMKDLKAVSSAGEVPLAVFNKEAYSLSGLWVNISLLGQKEIIINQGSVIKQEELYCFEDRTGVGLDENKKAKEGKLYTGRHIRLIDGVSIIIGFSKTPGVCDNGVLALGGEQRICEYREVEGPKFPDTGEVFVSLAPMKFEENMFQAILAAGKVSTSAGWDLAKGFHKPATSWLPAGTVFTEKINENFVPMAL